MPRIGMLLSVLLAPAGIALGADTTALEETVAQVQRALDADDYLAVATAFNRAKALRPQYTDEEFEPLAKQVAEGARHDDRSIALLSLKTLGELRTSGSARYLRRLLSPARSVDPAQLDLHLAAIEAAGLIGDEEVLSKLERLVLHDEWEIALAACGALAHYKWIDRKPRLVLIRRLVHSLTRLERRRPRSAEDTVALAKVKEALVATLRTLTRAETPATSDDFREWLRAVERGDPT